MSPLRRRDAFTICIAIPGFIPRQLSLEVLHDQPGVIKLNPLVTGQRTIPPPTEASADEFGWQWYEITEKIQLIPGVGKLGSGTFTFNGCFKDMPWGLMSHVHAPANIDMRVKYRVGGAGDYAVEGDGPEPEEMRLMDSLYLKADIEVECNFAVVSFVRSQSKTAIGAMVERMVKKAERMDAEVLQRMIEEDNIQRAKTVRVVQAVDKPTNAFTISELPATMSENRWPGYKAYSPATAETEIRQQYPESPIAYLAYNPHIHAVRAPTQSLPQRVGSVSADVEKVQTEYIPPRSRWHQPPSFLNTTYGNEAEQKHLPRTFSFETGSEQSLRPALR